MKLLGLTQPTATRLKELIAASPPGQYTANIRTQGQRTELCQITFIDSPYCSAQIKQWNIDFEVYEDVGDEVFFKVIGDSEPVVSKGYMGTTCANFEGTPIFQGTCCCPVSFPLSSGSGSPDVPFDCCGNTCWDVSVSSPGSCDCFNGVTFRLVDNHYDDFEGGTLGGCEGHISADLVCEDNGDFTFTVVFGSNPQTQTITPDGCDPLVFHLDPDGDFGCSGDMVFTLAVANCCSTENPKPNLTLTSTDGATTEIWEFAWNGSYYGGVDFTNSVLFNAFPGEAFLAGYVFCVGGKWQLSFSISFGHTAFADSQDETSVHFDDGTVTSSGVFHE